jgi:uncharacterized FlaG/YvyC family protein
MSFFDDSDMTQYSSKSRMPPFNSLQLNAAVHLDDGAKDFNKADRVQTVTSAIGSEMNIQKSEPFSEPTIKTNNVSLSFVYDAVAKSLHVVMTDKTSGEVVRKMSYTHFPIGTHQAEQLHGLLLDQMA